ncbi:hypothetical protein KIN20_034611 [Parelaphostrongylus tenuis]|uniref:Uncharacterized protein n=1 Tax=Parelaphostrongylus tenuis TaxID=148309 RepID=A0AAD5WK64_PARTN|nr:hypothetical protein KIN20_034611 [Parelaphostrongylus tenuis]
MARSSSRDTRRPFALTSLKDLHDCSCWFDLHHNGPNRRKSKVRILLMQFFS